VILFFKIHICRIAIKIFNITHKIDAYISSIFFSSDLSSKPDKVAIVTGGSKGIGAEVVKKLLQCDMEVIIGELFTKLLQYYSHYTYQYAEI